MQDISIRQFYWEIILTWKIYNSFAVVFFSPSYWNITLHSEIKFHTIFCFWSSGATGDKVQVAQMQMTYCIHREIYQIHAQAYTWAILSCCESAQMWFVRISRRADVHIRPGQCTYSGSCNLSWYHLSSVGLRLQPILREEFCRRVADGRNDRLTFGTNQ